MGRMLIQAAANLNIDVHILDPAANAPCASLATRFVQGNLKDYDTVLAFGQACDIITIEIEHVNVEALKALEQQGKTVYPQPEVIALIQDKRTQKQFYQAKGLPTAPFVLTDSRAALQQHTGMLPAVHKLGREGYDGRGVQMIHTEADLDKGFDAPGVLEVKADIDKELAVIVARNPSGQVKAYPATELAYHPTENLVEYLFAPASIDAATAQRAEALACQVIEALDMTGLLAVEMFLNNDGQLWVNEVAPRPHNSGHHTIEASYTSQYEQHLRTLYDMPLGNTDSRSPAVMVNLLGAAGHTGTARHEGIDAVLALPGAHVHLYGKKTTKPFRKMGHVTLTGPDLDTLKANAKIVKEQIRIVS